MRELQARVATGAVERWLPDPAEAVREVQEPEVAHGYSAEFLEIIECLKQVPVPR